MREAEKVRCGRTVGTTEYIEGESRGVAEQLWRCSFPLTLMPTHVLWNLEKLKVTVKEAIECHG